MVSHDGNVATSSTASDSVSWGKSSSASALLALAQRMAEATGTGRAAGDAEVARHRRVLSPVKAFGLAVLLAGVNPENLILTLGPPRDWPRSPGCRPPNAVVDRGFVVIASLTIAGPVLYALFGGDVRNRPWNAAKAWLTTHNAAVMAVLFLVFGVDLVAKGLPPLTPLSREGTSAPAGPSSPLDGP